MNKRLIAATVTAAAVAGLSIGAAATAAPAAAPPPCQASQLQPHFDGQQGAAGTFFDLWHFVNLGSTCQAVGFVGALNYGSDGRPLPTTVHWVGTKSTIVLAHGQQARWRFAYQDPTITGCAPEAAVNMIVTPPNNTSPVLAGRGVRSCNGVFTASPLEFSS